MEREVERLFGHALLEEAARRFGLKAGAFRKLGDFENYVFEAETEADGEPRILRLTHSSHRSDADIAAELAWVDYLTHEGVDGIPGCYRSLGGSFIEMLPVGETYFTACLFAKAKGVPPDYRDPAIWNERLFRAWGNVTGRMHAATSRYREAEGIVKRASWEDDKLLRQADHYVREGDGFVRERLDEVLAELRSLPRTPDVYGLIHTDMHPRNFFVEDGRIAVFDFDDAAYNFFAHDIAIPLYYAVNWAAEDTDEAGKNAFAAGFLQAFLDGYRRAYTLPDEASWQRALPAFLKLRDIVLYLVVNKKVPPEQREPRLQRMMAGIRERIARGVPIADTKF